MAQRPDIERLRRGVYSSTEAAECATYIEQLESSPCPGCRTSMAEWELLNKIVEATERLLGAAAHETFHPIWEELQGHVEALDTLRCDR